MPKTISLSLLGVGVHTPTLNQGFMPAWFLNLYVCSMETITKVPRSPQKSKDIVETVEHYKNLKPDHIPIGIVQALSLASSKNANTGFAPIKSVKLQAANGKIKIVSSHDKRFFSLNYYYKFLY